MNKDHSKIGAVMLAEAYKKQGNRFESYQLPRAIAIIRRGGAVEPLERIARQDLTVKEALGRAILAGPVKPCSCFYCLNERRRN